MTFEQELDQLLNRLVDESLDDNDAARLRAMLRSDTSARQRYRQFMQLHGELLWSQGAAASANIGPLPSTESPAHHVRTGRRWIAIVSTIAVGLLVSFCLFRPSEPARWGTVMSVHGAVSFRDDAGEQHVPVGSVLPSGELLLKGDSAAIQIRFPDLTVFSLNGDAEAVVDPSKHGHVNLRSGSLTAEVKPRPAEHPLVIVTPTARVQVLGTVLSVTADSERTRLHVDSGRVQVERLVDGRSIEVSGHAGCVASLNPKDEFKAYPVRPRRQGFVHEFRDPPPLRWKGAWLPAVDDAPGRVRSVPCVMGQRLDGEMEPVIHFGVTLRPHPEVEFGALPARAVLVFDYRVQESHLLQIMISARTPDGRFAGNFEIKVDSADGESLGAGFQRLTIPIDRFEPCSERHPQLHPGDEPLFLLFTSLGDDVAFEVSRVAVIAGGDGN